MNAVFDITDVRLETPRLILRPWQQEDLADFYEYASVDGVGQMAGWPPHESIKTSQEVLNRFIEQKKTFAIVLKSNEKVIGSLGVEFYGAEDKLTEFAAYQGRELGFVLSKDYWGKGIMPEAVNAVIRYCFDQLNFDFLLCGHFCDNGRSMRVQQKAGFVPYRRLLADTQMGTKKDMILNLLVNPKKDLILNFSHPETLVYRNT